MYMHVKFFYLFQRQFFVILFLGFLVEKVRCKVKMCFIHVLNISSTSKFNSGATYVQRYTCIYF